MWMNQYEIEEAAQRLQSHPVLGKATRFLQEFMEEVNSHSDGWPYWQPPAKAAAKLMAFVHGHMYGGMGAYPRLPEPTEAEFRKTLGPIKSFYTRRGNAAGMKMPTL